MADKEERILIKTYTPICNHLKCVITEYHDGYVDEDEICKLTHEKCEPKNCKNKVFSGMTRQEAIEKILKAICGKNRLERCYKCSYKDTEKCIKFCKDNYIEQAEAALNALLEGGEI